MRKGWSNPTGILKGDDYGVFGLIIQIALESLNEGSGLFSKVEDHLWED